MCESDVVIENNQPKLIKGVVKIVTENENLVIHRMLAKEIKLKAWIKEIDLLSHRIVLRKE